MKAEIIPVGTEILLGNIVDTNSCFLAGQLPALGIDLYFISVVGDNHKRLLSTLRRAWRRASLIITTGGLGPTQDDITRECIAELVDEELEVDDRLWRDLQSLFIQHHWQLPECNIRQAAIVPSARAIPNFAGTAPGWWLEKDNHIVVALPGPEDEMRAMWVEDILPELQQKLTGDVIMSRTIKTFGLSEARMDELLAPLLHLCNPTLATYVKPDGVHLRITVKAKGEAEAKEIIAQRETESRNRISPYIWGVDNDTLESVVAGLLEAKHLSLATMESCTGGLLSDCICTSPESSSYFRGGLVACCDEAKTILGLDAHAPEYYDKGSNDEAQAMAEAVRRNFRADLGLAVSGSINPDENSADVFIGLNGDKLKRTRSYAFLGNRLRIKQRAVYAALFELSKALLEEV